MTEFAALRERTGLSIEDLSWQLGFSARTLYRWEKGETRPRKAAITLLNTLTKTKRHRCNEHAFRFIDLFAGIGGLRKGFDSIGGKCVFTSEWNKYSIQTYRANYECDHDIVGDITQIQANQIPEHDVLAAGFPCQPFSIAGVSKKNSLNRPHGFRCDAQGTLFFDVARLIETHRPKAFLLENVKNLVNHDKGKTFKVIHQTLTSELGYNVSYKVIDAKSWVPQHRERIFIVGFRDDTNFTLDDLIIPGIETAPKLSAILHPQDGSEDVAFNARFLHGKKGRVLDKYTLSDKLWNYLQGYAEKHRRQGNGFGFGLVTPDDISRTLSARYYKDGSEILIKQKGRNPRRLTPAECARLMGFDHVDEQKKFIIPVSDTQAYKQFGNAVVVPVVKSIARLMEPFLVNKSGSNSRPVQKKRFKVG